MLRIIFGLALTLFIPGFAITLMLFPRRMRPVERIAFSSVLSIATVLIVTLFIDLGLGVDTTAENIVIALLTVTAFALLIWSIRI